MPASTSGHEPFTAWLREHATTLTTLDPADALDDLEPLRELVEGARVVAIGESSHFIREFASARHRILRFLAERCGFTVLAFEYGFSEGFAINSWAERTGTGCGLEEVAEAAVPVGLAEPLHWLRDHNDSAVRPVAFAGIDLPAAGGSLLPALTPLADYLRRVDPDVLPLLDRATGIAERFAGASMVRSLPAWGRLGAADQDALSALLMRLLIRFRAVEPRYVDRSDSYSYDVALRRLEAACHTDQQFRAMADLHAGNGLPGDTSVREEFMAGSVRWHLERSGPGARVVLAAHNAHIQKLPIVYDGGLTTLPMGQHLHRALGDGYLALGLTSTSGRTAEMRLDEAAPFGFTVDDTPLGPPEPGSAEAAFEGAGIGLGLADLRRAPRSSSGGDPDRIRMHGSFLRTPVLDAFDGIINIPGTTVADDIGY